jgi:hypothetical protein
MKTRLPAFLLLCALTAACGGIPLRSLPRLMALQNDVLNANPTEFMLAIQVDTRMVPPSGAVPALKLIIRPANTGDFAPIDETLPMCFTATKTGTLGLPAPPGGRQWLVYSLPAESQNELLRIQGYFKGLRQQQHGATLGLGIAQDGLAARDPALAGTRWESWLQTSVAVGFFELWSGSVADLLKSAKSRQ